MSSLPQPLPPVPVQPIVYSAPVAQRPTLITAIGVISIVVGSLGLLFNGIAGLQAFGFMMISNMTRAMTARQAAVTTAAQAPAVADPMSMPMPDRQTVIRGLSMVRPISEPRRQQLDALLSKSGRQIYRLSGADLTLDVVRQSVTESGRFPDAKGGEGTDFFVIGEGRIELADDHAKFVPGDGRETVRVSASETAEQANWQAGLTPAQVKAIIDKIEQQAGTPLPAAQKSKLDLMLNSPAQGFFTPAATIPEVTSQVQSVSTFNNNGAVQLTVTTGQGMVSLDGQGNTISSTTWAGGGGAAFAAAGPGLNVNMTAATVAIICALLSFCLAIYLLVIGILMLRQHPRAGRLHKIYAWLKIPLAIAGGIAWVTLWTSLFRGAAVAAGGTAPNFTPAVIIGSVIAITVGCIYPIALLVALRTKSVREYYSTVQ